MSLEMIRRAFSMPVTVSSAERLVLLALADCHNGLTGKCYPSVRTLHKMTGLTQKWVTETLKSLEGHKLIIREHVRKPNGIGWCYALTIPSTIDEDRGVPNTGVVSTGVANTGVASTPQEAYSVPPTDVLPTPKQEYNKKTTGIHICASSTKKQSHFSKPTEEDVRAYCKEQCYSDVDPADFIDYYESTGWKVGKAPMKDWKRTVNRWHRRHCNSKSVDDAKNSTVLRQSGYTPKFKTIEEAL